MAEQVNVDLQDNSPYRVALELTRTIAKQEAGQKQDRDYWLKLYLQCRSVVLKGIQIKEAG
jgi:hypothetical protein